MSGVISDIINWASLKLKYWEQLALYNILAGKNLDESIYKELLNHLLIDNSLITLENNRPDINFKTFDESNKEAKHSSIQICEIRNLQNVNALVPKQSLPFGSALTVVYGANGSGKSGYARVLGCVGFIRSNVDIFPNINDPNCSTLTPVAEIEIKDDNVRRCINYSPNQECEELNSLHVFDVKSVQEHLIKKNTFTFTPTGLSYLTKLAEVTDKVRESLLVLIEEKRKPLDFSPLFQDGDSPIKSMIIELNSKTDLSTLKKVSELSKSEQDNMVKLDKKIAELKTKNISEQIANLEKTKVDLNILINKINNLINKLSNEFINNIQDNINKYNSADFLVKKIGIDQFKTDFFSKIGSKIWYDFIKAAKALAEQEQIDNNPYPQDNDKCLLCHQSLSKEARELIQKLWIFLEGEAQSNLNNSTSNLKEYKNILDEIDFNFFNDQTVSYRYLENYDNEKKTNLVTTITSFIEYCNKQVETLIKIIDNKDSKITVFKFPESGLKGIESIIVNLNKQFDILHKSDPTEEIKNLEAELRNLKHKKILSEQLPDISSYINRLAWAETASKVGGSTRPITLKYDEMFEEIVTGGYLKLFQEILNCLGRPIHVKVDTTPRKGVTFRQLTLETDSKTLPLGANPDTILSEGEKRAVALADFLTEVALDTDSGGIVLDDPVTSLDLEWCSVIASLLVKESNKRQVIIFTHSLPFVHYLKNFSNDQQVEIQMHWIKRGDHDDQPGYVFANNSPALESGYKNTNIAKEHCNKAKNFPPEDQEKELKQGFGALRTTYESFIINKLLAGVVIRWDERISPGKLKEIIYDKDLFQKVIDKHEHLSRYIEGHLHSDSFVPIKPTPNNLNKEILEFEEIMNEYKKLKKS